MALSLLEPGDAESAVLLPADEPESAVLLPDDVLDPPLDSELELELELELPQQVSVRTIGPVCAWQVIRTP